MFKLTLFKFPIHKCQSLITAMLVETSLKAIYFENSFGLFNNPSIIPLINWIKIFNASLWALGLAACHRVMSQ